MSDKGEDQLATYDYEQVLDLAIYIAYGIPTVGGETGRAEDSCRRVLQAYGCDRIEVMVMANFLTLSFEYKGEKYHGQKRISDQTSSSMLRLNELNNLTRKLTAEPYDPGMALNEVKTILDAPKRPFTQHLALVGLVGFTFTLLLDGSLGAALFAFVIDLVARAAIEPLYQYKTNQMFVNIFGGLLVTLLSACSIFLGLGEERGIINTATFMFLFPGVSLVNSIRDIIASDYLAGATKLIQTILVALGIAIGSGIGLSILSRFAI
ncbi:MAG: threonine/serine exporter family protein [Eubacteriales bacterium]|nr:threonine/serine exporter family protein [Eubacteriales bacterium]